MERRLSHYLPTLKSTAVLALLASPVASQDAEPPLNLCTEGEKIWFSARETDALDLISVCGSEDPTLPDAWLQLRFGTPFLLRETIPAAKENSLSEFAVRLYTRPRTSYFKFEIRDGARLIEIHTSFEADAPEGEKEGAFVRFEQDGEPDLDVPLDLLTDWYPLMSLSGPVKELEYNE